MGMIGAQPSLFFDYYHITKCSTDIHYDIGRWVLLFSEWISMQSAAQLSYYFSRTASLDDSKVTISLSPLPLHNEHIMCQPASQPRCCRFRNLHTGSSKSRRAMFETKPSISSPIPDFPYPIQNMRTKNIILFSQPHSEWGGHKEII